MAIEARRHRRRRYHLLVAAITWKVFHVYFPNVLCMLLMTSSRTSSIMAEKKIKMADYCVFSHFTSIILPCGRDNLKNLLCMLLVISSRTSSIMAEKKKWPIYCDFTSIIWLCWRDSMKSFLCIIPKFVMHVTTDQFSDKFNNGWKKIKMAEFLPFTSII